MPVAQQLNQRSGSRQNSRTVPSDRVESGSGSLGHLPTVTQLEIMGPGFTRGHPDPEQLLPPGHHLDSERLAHGHNGDMFQPVTGRSGQGLRRADT